MEEATKDQLIQDYLEGNLKGKAKTDFEIQLDQDPSLATEVKDLQQLDLGLQRIGAEQFASEIREWEEDYRHSQGGGRKLYPFRSYYSIAAVISLLIVAAIFLYRNPESEMEQLYAQHYEPYEDMILSRGEVVEDAQALLVEGMEAYDQQQYVQAEESLRAYLDNTNEKQGVALYLGIAQMENHHFAQAEASFANASQDPNFEQQAQWYLALMFLRSEQEEKAKSALQVIAQNPQHYKSSEADAILEEFN